MKPILVVALPKSDGLRKNVPKYFNEWEGKKDYYVLFKFGDELAFELLSVGKARKIDFDKLREEILTTIKS